MRLFTYICFCFSLFVFSSEQETLEANKKEKFLSASELETLKALIPGELRYEIPEIPNNSFLDLQEFLKEKDVPRFSDQERRIIKKIEDFKKVSSKDLRDLTHTLDKQKIFFDQFQLCINDRPHVLIPLEPTFLSFDLALFRSAIQYYNVKVLISYRKKEYGKAIKLLEQAVYVTQKLERRKGALIDQLTVMACKGIIYERISWVLRHKNQSFKQVEELEKVLGVLQPPAKLWDDTVRYEMFFSLKMFEVTPLDLELVEDIAEIIEIFDKELEKVSDEDFEKEDVSKEELKDFKNDAVEFMAVKNLYSFIFRDFLQASTAFLADVKNQPLEDHKNFKQYLGKRKGISNQLLRRIAMGPIYYSNLRGVAGGENHRQALLLIVAIRKYELKYKRLPKNFNAMIAGAVLSEIPKDMWTGKQLKVDIKNRYVEFDYTNKTETKRCYF